MERRAPRRGQLRIHRVHPQRPEVRHVPELRQLRRPQAHGTLRHRNRRGAGRHHLRKLRLQRRRLAAPLHRDRLFEDTDDMDSQGRPLGHFGLRTLRRHPRGNHRRENGVIKSSRNAPPGTTGLVMRRIFRKFGIVFLVPYNKDFGRITRF